MSEKAREFLEEGSHVLGIIFQVTWLQNNYPDIHYGKC